MENIPYIAYESGLARLERVIKRLWILSILLIILLVGSNVGWLWYESQFADTVTTTSIESSSESGNATGIIGDGNGVNYGKR